MFNFQGITHLTQFPSGKFGFVGAVPLSIMTERPATAADVMAGRERNGKAYDRKGYESVNDAIMDATRNNVNLCALKGCACRQLF